MTELTYQEKIQLMASWLHEKKGADLVGIDLSQTSSVTEAALLVSGKNTRHVQSLADCILEGLGKKKLSYLGMEGYKSGLWVLIDCNDVLVHIFQESSRGFYNLEGLFAQEDRIELQLEGK